MNSSSQSLRGSSRRFRPLSHQEIVQEITDKKMATAQKQMSQTFQDLSPKKRPIAEMFERRDCLTREPFMQQVQVMVQRRERMMNFNLPLRLKLAEAYHEEERRISKNLNLEPVQCVRDEDFVADQTIVNLNGDSTIIVNTNKVIAAAPLRREVVHYDITQRDTWAQLEADLFLPTAHVDKKAELLTRDMRKYQRFVQGQLEASYGLIVQIQNYKLQLVSRVQQIGQQFVQLLYHQAKHLLLAGSEENTSSQGLARRRTSSFSQKQHKAQGMDSSEMVKLHNDLIFSDLVQTPVQNAFQMLDAQDADYDLVFEQ